MTPIRSDEGLPESSPKQALAPGDAIKIVTRDGRNYVGRFGSRNKEFLVIASKSAQYSIPRRSIRTVTRISEDAYGFGRKAFLWGDGKDTTSK